MMPIPHPRRRYPSFARVLVVLVIIFDDVRTHMRWFTFAYSMHANLSPIRYFEMYILCCSISKWPVMFRLHLRVADVLLECWLISVPANFRRSICPFLAKVMPDFSVNLNMTCARICRKYRVPQICVLSFLVVAFDRFAINVSTMNIGNVVWRRKRFH